MNKLEELTRISKALSVKTRVRIIYVLKRRALCVGALSERLGISQGAVSQHLRVLREADLVKPERRSYFVHYRLNEEGFARWKEAIELFIGTDAAKTRSRARAVSEKSKELSMCDSKAKCQKPEELKGKRVGKCSPAQVKKCHGSVKERISSKPAG